MEEPARRIGARVRAQLHEAESDDPESSRSRAFRRDMEQLGALRAFALPVLDEMAAWPPSQSWGEWLGAITGLATRVLAQPARVLRVLQELSPLDAIGPVDLHEVRDVLTPRLSTLTHEPPRRRHGRLFVGTPHAARGRAFRVVFVPGLAERLFPQRLREDALLPDEQRHALGGALPTQQARAADERQHLTLAVGAASERLYLSFPRIEVEESRPRVPSFYVLDTMRAIEGGIPAASALVERAHQAGASTLAWPAPTDPGRAIDDFEHDLATMAGLLASKDAASAKGRARYLYELSPELRRSLTSRWLRWHRRGWDPADGLVRVVARHHGTRTGRPAPGGPALFAHRVAALLGVPVSVPAGGHLPAGAARATRAAAAARSAHARQSLPPHPGAHLPQPAGARAAAALDRGAAEGAEAAGMGRHRRRAGGLRPTGAGHRPRVARRDGRHDARPQAVARARWPSRAPNGRPSASSSPSASTTPPGATSAARAPRPASSRSSSFAAPST